jgi:hypothetical protein
MHPSILQHSCCTYESVTPTTELLYILTRHSYNRAAVHIHENLRHSIIRAPVIYTSLHSLPELLYLLMYSNDVFTVDAVHIQVLYTYM